MSYDADIQDALIASEAAAKAADLDTAVRTLDELAEMKKDLGIVIAAWNTRLVDLLQKSGPVEVNGQTLKAIPKFVERYDHDLIAKRMIRKAFVSEDGEAIEDVETAMKRLWSLFQKTYLAPSTKPKNTGLAILGFETPKAALASRKEDGYELHRSV